MSEILLTEKELCAWLKISRATAWRWRQEGLPYLKYGKSVRFEEAAVLDWLKKQNQK